MDRNSHILAFRRPRSARSAPIRRPRGTGVAVLLATTLAAACGSTNPRPQSTAGGDGHEPETPTPTPAARAEFDLYLLGRVLGTIAPCGCTTEPLGGLQYAFGFVDGDSAESARLVVEPGSFLYPDPDGPEWPTNEPTWAQAERRASTLQGRFAELGDHLVSGFGPIDVRSPKGVAALSAHPLPRVLANLATPAEGLTAPPKHRLAELTDADRTLQVGVTAVVDPTTPEAAKLGALSDPAVALKAEVKAMRDAGAHVTVALVYAERPVVEQLARDIEGLDIAVVGIVDGLERERLGTPTAHLGDTFVVEAGEQLQTMTHLRLSLAPGAEIPTDSTQWTVVPPRAIREDELARVEERLAKFEKDADADPAFLDSLRAERDELKQALEAPPTGDRIAVFDQVKVTCKLPVDDDAKASLKAYNDWVSAQNLERFADVEPPPAPPGEASYVGDDECETCHEEALAYWKTTVHAGAYQTLVDTNQQYDLSCVGCHVTAFRKPGGSEVVKNEPLRDVQCEQCHGPGSKHVEEPEKGGKALSIRLDAPREVCEECHTPEHSDTFEYDAYLRDILGEGHGKARREALGEGPTGAKLRAEGLAKAGGSCKKM